MSLLFNILKVISFLTFTMTDLVIQDEYEYEGIIYSCGSVSVDDADGIVMAKDANTEEMIYRTFYDDEANETFKYLAIVANGDIFIVCEKYSVDGTLFLETKLLRIDSSGAIVDELSLEEQFINYYNHGNILILETVGNELLYFDDSMEEISDVDIKEEFAGEFSLQYRGEVYINGLLTQKVYVDDIGVYNIEINENNKVFRYVIEVVPELYIIGELVNDIFVSSVKIVCDYDVYVNDELYKINEYYEVPGNYDIQIYGSNNYVYTSRFLIIPTLTYRTGNDFGDFEDGLFVYEPLSIQSNAISMYLNDTVYNSELIEEVGEHTLKVYGINGMEYDYAFNVYPKVYGIENFGEYDEISFSVFGNAILNGEIISGNISITEPGDYVLDLMFDDDIYAKYYFKVVDESIPVDETKGFNFNYVIGLVIVIGGILFFRKK